MKWKYLKPGDIIDIVATAPGVSTQTLEQDLNAIKKFILELGFTPRFNIKKIATSAEFFDDNGLKIRQEELIEALVNNSSKAIWFLRGGYGAFKLLDGLNDLVIPAIPKLLIGFSDLNAIHIWINKKWGWPSLHYRNLYDFRNDQDFADLGTFKQIISGKLKQVIYSNLIALNELAKTTHEIEGCITGGTIQVLQAGIGLSWQFDAENKILFFEEVFDRGVRIDRALYQFKQLKLFDKAKAIIFGDIVCGSEGDGSKNCEQAIKYFAENINIPVYSIADIGHAHLNFPLPLNTAARIKKINDSASIEVTSGGF